MLVRTVECIDGSVELELVCEPVFDYGRDTRRPGSWSTTTGTPPTPAAPASPSGSRPTWRSASRAAACAAATCCRPGERAYCALSWADGLAAPDDVERRRRPHRRHRAVLAALAGAPPASPTTLPRARPALGAGDQGPDLHADRRHRGRADHLAAGDAGRRAQLGLPLHLDARLHLHAAGAALAEPGLGGRRVHAVRRRPRADRGRLAADHVRHRRAPRPDRVDPRRPLRLRRRAAGADRQRRLRPAPERRVRRRARLDPAAHPPQPAPAAAAVADRADRRPSAPPRSGATPTRASGRRAASRSTTCRRS